MGKDFFISYTGVDESWATWIAAELERQGYSTVIQAWDFGPASNFVLGMHQASRSAERTLLVLSPAALESEFVSSEWAVAFQADPTGSSNKLVPVRVRECEPDGLLASIVYIDLVGLDADSASSTLRDGISRAVAGADRAAQVGAAQFPVESGRNVSTSSERFPGDLPPIWNVPPRARTYAARDELSEKIDGHLAGDVPVALVGLGGVGKTRAAVEIAYRMRAELDVVWWIRSESENSIRADLSALANRLQLPVSEFQDQEESALAALQWLNQNSRWMLVFDDSGEPGGIVDWLPEAGRGSVVVTSRNDGNWSSVATEVRVSTFSRDESIAFLRTRTGSQNDLALFELAERLGDLPLALEQAAAYIERTAISVEDYLERYEKHERALLDSGKPLDYPATVATTWLLNFEALKDDPGAIALLRVAAMLGPDRIPREVFVAEEFSEFAQPDANAEAVLLVDDGISQLRGFSLLLADPKYLEVHRLVQLIVRDSLDDVETSEHNHIAQLLVEKVFPSEPSDPSTWEVADGLMVHGLTTTGRAVDTGWVSGATANLQFLMAGYQRFRMEFDSATELFEHAVAIGEQLGAEANGIISALLDLADIAVDVSRDEAAGGYLERAVEMANTAFDADSIEMGRVLRNIGSVQRRLGRPAEGEASLTQALQIAESHPELPEDLVTVLVNLSNIKTAEEALPLLERARSIAEEFELDDPQTHATILTNLGRAYVGLGRLPEALDCQRNAVRIFEDAFGPEFPRIAPILGSIGFTLMEINEIGEAKVALLRELEIQVSTFGDGSPPTVKSRIDLADLMQRAHEIEDAYEYAVEAVKFAEAAGEPEAALLSEALDRLGDIQREVGVVDAAETNLRRSLAIQEHLGLEPQGSTLLKLGAVLRVSGDPQGAVAILRQAVEALDEAGADVSQRAAARNNLGNALGDAGDFNGAVESLEECLALTEAMYGDSHPQTAIVLVNLAIALHSAGDATRSEEVAARGIEIDPTLGEIDN